MLKRLLFAGLKRAALILLEEVAIPYAERAISWLKKRLADVPDK
jgi:hypothetical protein